MGKLNIAHHKSYHPYRRDNIERVRRDEEEAAKKIAVQEGRMMLADSEARIDLLRQRAGLNKPQRVRSDSEDEVSTAPQPGPSTITTSKGHINFFEDMERQSLPVTIRTTKKSNETETDKGFRLAPSEKDLNPWYSDKHHEKNRELEDDRKLRDLARKSVHDPLTAINSQLIARSSREESSSSRSRSRPVKQSATSSQPPIVSERLNRESSERQRALELIRRKKREMEGSETPSTVYGGRDEGYRDVFNKREVEEAHRHRERRWDRFDDRSQGERRYNR
ncbi:hypothetical protein C8Q75DRAFT_748280 [Abortiporus biennis]|nr:hypothetical protein C8Q75DRAFT_748280 [Abortiporus biennis]